MDELTAFIAARYDEAQARAEAAATTEDGAVWVTSNAEDSDKRVIRTPAPDWRWIGEHYTETAEHITDTDPAHRLADITLKRAILAAHPHCRVDYSMTLRTDLDEPFGCSTCDWDRDYGQGGEGWCATVRQLGTEFSDHPDYKPGWRPDDTAAAAP